MTALRMRPHVWAGWTMVLLLITAAPTYGCFSGQVIIPTAETVGAGQYGFEWQTDGALPTPKADTYFLNTEFGIGDRLEVGADQDYSEHADPRTLLNAKYLIGSQNKSPWHAGVGVCNVGRHAFSMPYAVVTRDLSALRVHFGEMRIESKDRWFTGFDYALNKQWTLMADYTSGEENVSSVGVNRQFNNKLSLLAGVEFPNIPGGTLFTLHLVLNGP